MFSLLSRPVPQGTALSRDPNDRYKDAAALGQVFDRCRARLDPAGTQSAPRSAGATSTSPQPSVRAGAAYAAYWYTRPLR